MTGLSMELLGKTYGSVRVMENLSLDIDDGEFVILVGPSGCGKSTLLRMIAGLEEITEGTLRIGDRVVNDARPRDRNIAMVFQSYALYPHKTVAQNMGFSLKIKGSSRQEIDEKVGAAAAILDLSHLLDRYPKQLSGGQRQRVAMGRAIVRDPDVFLFDEPLSNLDAKLRVQMRTEIKALHERLRSTIVYVTHDQIEAMTMADRIVVMNGGRIEQVGRPLDLYDHPANLFVAEFIGSPSMNLLRGRVEDGEGRHVFVSASGLRVPLDRRAPPGDVVLGIRPEHFVLTDDERATKARVLVYEPSGAETQLSLEVGGETVLATFSDRIEAKPGDMLRIAWSTKHLHVFDAHSGARIADASAG